MWWLLSRNKNHRLQSKRSVEIDEKIATVAVYSIGNNEDLDYWENFFQLPVDYATDNKKEIDAEINSYPLEQWQKLNNGLSEIEKAYKKGLYKIEKANSD